MLNLWLFIFLSFLQLSSLCTMQVVIGGVGDSLMSENPFTPKAYFIRYWNKKICCEISHTHFLTSKASPLTAVDSAAYSKLASQNDLATRLPSFCSSAKLFCLPDLTSNVEKHSEDAKFVVYSIKNFTNYERTDSTEVTRSRTTQRMATSPARANEDVNFFKT